MTDTEGVFAAIALVLSFAAVASYINHRYLNFPPTIALMAMSLILSLTVDAYGLARREDCSAA